MPFCYPKRCRTLGFGGRISISARLVRGLIRVKRAVMEEAQEAPSESLKSREIAIMLL
jgi:hypothetical protein